MDIYKRNMPPKVLSDDKVVRITTPNGTQLYLLTNDKGE